MSSPLSKNKIIAILIILLALLIGVALFLIMTKPKQTSFTIDPNARTTSTLTGDFTLMDEDGKTVTPETYQGQYKLISFGFTHCPSICPAEMLKIADVMAALPVEQAARITPLLITIDPARDTPDTLKRFTTQFHPRIVGLTGTDRQIRAAIDAFKVYAARMDNHDPNDQDYMFDHSTFLYLFGPDHQLIKLYRMEETAEFIAGDLKGMM